MSYIPEDACLQPLGTQKSTSMYQLQADGLSNQYYIVSGEGTRHLMASPEVVGYESYLSMTPSTTAALRYFSEQGLASEVDILTILRGGLNYPLEECCYKAGIRVPNMNFISCERKIENGVITGLDIKYEKLHIAKDITLMIGDIIASGDTLRLCLTQVVDRFRRRGGSLKRIIFFTVGGTRAIELMEKKTEEFRRIFPEFEGFECFFYEGVFTVYESAGVTGINVPDIDFGWKGGVVAPEFRRYVLDHPYSILEKCIIYDGGARRYEIPLHFREVLEYWEGIRSRADRIDLAKLAGEKLGYDAPLSFEQWLAVNRFEDLKDEGLETLWADETEFLKDASALSLESIATQRIQAIKTNLQQYE